MRLCIWPYPTKLAYELPCLGWKSPSTVEQEEDEHRKLQSSLMLSAANANTSASAQAAFDKALELVRADHPSSSITTQWLKDAHTITDVEDEVRKAKLKYESKPKGRCRRWLGELSLGIMHYASILDALVQHHPEYVSLAWGTTKLLFVLFQNREELLAELTKSFVMLNGLLPRVQIQANVFDDPRMQYCVQMLYADIIRYFHAMFRFYEEGRAKRIWKSFVQPFSLRFDDIAERVDMQSRVISGLAAALSQERQQKSEALIRQTHDVLLDMRRDLAAQQSLMIGHISMTKDMRTAGMIEAAKSDEFPDPCDVLDLRVSLSKRQHKRKALNIDGVWTSASLRAWSSAPESAILIVQGSLSKKPETLAVGTSMAKFMQFENVPVLWALQNVVNYQPVKTSPLQILKYLAMQALRQHQDTIGNHVSESFNQTRISSAHTTQHWTTILKSALESVPITYVLIDLDLMDLDDSSAMLQALLQSLSDLIEKCKPSVLKIVLINKMRTVSVDIQSVGSETLNLEKVLLDDLRISRTRGRQRANNIPLRGTASLAFRLRLKSQNTAKTSQRSF